MHLTKLHLTIIISLLISHASFAVPTPGRVDGGTETSDARMLVDHNLQVANWPQAYRAYVADPFFSSSTDRNIQLNDLSQYAGLSLGYRRSEPLFKFAIATLQKRHAPAITMLTARFNLAQLYEKTSQLKEAQSGLEHILQDLGTNPSPEDVDLYVVCSSDLAGVYNDLHILDRVEPTYLRALKILRRVTNHRREDEAAILNGLAMYDVSIGRLDKAEPPLRAALDLISNSPDYAPEYATGLINLAMLYRDTHRRSKSWPLFEQALDIEQSIHGMDSPRYVSQYLSIASALIDGANSSDDEGLFVGLRERAEKYFGKESLQYLAATNIAAIFYFHTLQYDKAEKLISEVINQLPSLLGKTHPYYAISISSLGALYEVTHRQDQAFATEQSAMQMEQSNLQAVFAFSSEGTMLGYLRKVDQSLDVLLTMSTTSN